MLPEVLRNEDVDARRNSGIVSQENPKTLRHHSDDRTNGVIELYGFPDDARITAVAALPDPIAKDHHIGAILGFFLGQEVSPEDRILPE